MTKQKGLQFSISPYVPCYHIIGFVKDANWAKFWIWRFEISWWK